MGKKDKKKGGEEEVDAGERKVRPPAPPAARAGALAASS